MKIELVVVSAGVTTGMRAIVVAVIASVVIAEDTGLRLQRGFRSYIDTLAAALQAALLEAPGDGTGTQAGSSVLEISCQSIIHSVTREDASHHLGLCFAASIAGFERHLADGPNPY